MSSHVHVLPARQRGMTLIELVISIVIIGIAAAALYSAMATIGARSADPMLRQQSLALAEAYLEAVLARPYAELDGAAHGPQAPRDSDGNPIAELAAYRVSLAVSPASLNGVAARHIEVTVADPQGEALQLGGWRTCYGESGC